MQSSLDYVGSAWVGVESNSTRTQEQRDVTLVIRNAVEGGEPEHGVSNDLQVREEHARESGDGEISAPVALRENDANQEEPRKVARGTSEQQGGDEIPMETDGSKDSSDWGGSATHRRKAQTLHELSSTLKSETTANTNILSTNTWEQSVSEFFKHAYSSMTFGSKRRKADDGYPAISDEEALELVMRFQAFNTTSHNNFSDWVILMKEIGNAQVHLSNDSSHFVFHGSNETLSKPSRRVMGDEGNRQGCLCV